MANLIDTKIYGNLQVNRDLLLNVGTLTIDGTAVTTTASELNYVSGVTSSIQDQLDGKQDALTLSSTSVSDGTNTFNKYVHPTTSGNKHIPSGGSAGNILEWSSNGTAVWSSNSITSINIVRNNVTVSTAVSSIDFITGSGTTWNSTNDQLLVFENYVYLLREGVDYTFSGNNIVTTGTNFKAAEYNFLILKNPGAPVSSISDLADHEAATSVHSATNLNTPSRIVMRDGTGGFSAGKISATGATLTGTLTSRALGPSTTNAYDIGTSSVKYRHGYFSGNINAASGVLSGSLDVASGTTTSHIIVDGSSKVTGSIYGGSTAPSSSTRLNYDGYFYATRVYNAVFNDIVDFIETEKEIDIEYGKVYTRSKGGICTTSKKDKGALGIASDTYGFGVGKKEDINQIPIAIGGWVLAYIDKKYDFGTHLTYTDDGVLTKASLVTRLLFPAKIVAIYDREENKEEWNNIEVRGRHWVKVI